MSYETPVVIRAWTDYTQRKPFKYTITGYLNGSPVGSPVVVYTEQEMLQEFAAMRDALLPNRTVHKYDQVKVQQQDIVVPSVTE